MNLQSERIKLLIIFLMQLNTAHNVAWVFMKFGFGLRLWINEIPWFRKNKNDKKTNKLSILFICLIFNLYSIEIKLNKKSILHLTNLLTKQKFGWQFDKMLETPFMWGVFLYCSIKCSALFLKHLIIPLRLQSYHMPTAIWEVERKQERTIDRSSAESEKEKTDKTYGIEVIVRR